MSTQQGSSLIQGQVQDQVMTLQIMRPERKNALNLDMYRGLTQYLLQAEAEEGVRVIVLAGSGGCFTSGNDLQDFAQGAVWDDESPVLQFMRTLTSCRKPVVAAVHGLAVGIGTTLLLHCDLIYAHPDSTFQMPFVTLGLCPEFAASLLLPQAVGMARAREWLLTGKAFMAQDAFQAGLLTELAEDPWAAAQAAARHLAQLPPGALSSTKALLRDAQAGQVEATMNREKAVFAQALQGPEFAEAVTAFFEKRPADFSRATRQSKSGE